MRPVLVIVVLLAATAAFSQQRHALVVGNSSYEVGRLTSPRADAQAVEGALRNLKFDVVRRNDLNQNDLREALRDFSRRLSSRPGSTAVFYFSGHGMQINGVNYLVPTGALIETEADVEVYGVRLDEVVLRMRTGSTSTSVLILDACRNNPYEKKFKTQVAGLARPDAPPGTLIAFAAAPGSVAPQSMGGALSPYTAALVASIAQPRPFLLTLQKVANDVFEMSNRKQAPHIEISAGLAIDFWLSDHDGPTPFPRPTPIPDGRTCPFGSRLIMNECVTEDALISIPSSVSTPSRAPVQREADCPKGYRMIMNECVHESALRR